MYAFYSVAAVIAIALVARIVGALIRTSDPNALWRHKARFAAGRIGWCLVTLTLSALSFAACDAGGLLEVEATSTTGAGGSTASSTSAVASTSSASGAGGSGGAQDAGPTFVHCTTVTDCSTDLCAGQDCCGIACDTNAPGATSPVCHSTPLPDGATCSFDTCSGHCVSHTCSFDVSQGCDDAGLNCSCGAPDGGGK